MTLNGWRKSGGIRSLGGVLLLCSLVLPRGAEARSVPTPARVYQRLVDGLKARRLAAAARRGLPMITKKNPVRALPRGPQRRLVVGVMASAAPEHTIAPGLKVRLERLGQEVAQRGDVVLTGACPGMPHVVARAAKRAGGFTVGVSPAGSLKEHTQRFHAPTDSLDVIQMTGTGPGMGFIAREEDNIRNSDIMVFAGGRSGTLGEILFAMQERKVIALLEDSSGVTSALRKQILPLIGNGRGIFVADTDPARLMQKAYNAHARLERRHGASAQGQRQGWLRKLGAPLRQLWHRVRQRPLITDQVTRDHTVFTFFGTVRGTDDQDRAKVMTLVQQIAQDRTGGRKPLLVTPARAGLPAHVAKAAQALGVKTVGFSSAATAREALRPGRPHTMYDAIQLTGEGPGVGELAAYQHGIKKADVVFVAGGDHRTLGGTVFAMYQPTVVAVLETKGMSGKLRSHILSTFDKPAHATMIYDSDPVRLYSKAVQAAEKLRHSERTEYIAPE